MKRLILLFPLLTSCLPESPKDQSFSVPRQTDPLSESAWHLENTGQKAFSNGAGIVGEDHKIKLAHQLGYTGKNIRIAISDDGVEIEHPDLQQNQLVGEHRDYTSGLPADHYKGDPTPLLSKDAHGTAVTGLVSAVKGNSIGSYGVAPDALFAGFNFLTSTQDPPMKLHQFTGSFDIFNYSYGLPGYIISDVFNTAHETALSIGSINQKKIYIKAAGNSFIEQIKVASPTPPSPRTHTAWGNANFEAEQTLPYYIMVGAVNARGVRSSYSTPGSNLWISGAGGEDGYDTPAMITTDLQGCSRGYAHGSLGYTQFDLGKLGSNIHCDFTNTMNGTSSAAPVISGIVALMLEANPNLTWRDVKHILAKTADKVDQSPNNLLNHPALTHELPGHDYDYKWVTNHAGNSFSNWYGFGRANAKKAVEMAENYSFPLGTYIPGSYSTSTLSTPVLIPSNATGLTDTITLTSPVTKIEAVQIEVQVDHSFIGDLGVELTSPSETSSKLLLINSMGLNAGADARTIQLLSNAFYEENPNGVWTLKVLDGDQAEHSGYLVGWKIKVSGNNQP